MSAIGPTAATLPSTPGVIPNGEPGGYGYATSSPVYGDVEGYDSGYGYNSGVGYDPNYGYGSGYAYGINQGNQSQLSLNDFAQLGLSQTDLEYIVSAGLSDEQLILLYQELAADQNTVGGGNVSEQAEVNGGSNVAGWNSEFEQAFDNLFKSAGVSDAGRVALLEFIAESGDTEAGLLEAYQFFSTPEGAEQLKVIDSQIAAGDPSKILKEMAVSGAVGGIGTVAGVRVGSTVLTKFLTKAAQGGNVRAANILQNMPGKAAMNARKAIGLNVDVATKAGGASTVARTGLESLAKQHGLTAKAGETSAEFAQRIARVKGISETDKLRAITLGEKAARPIGELGGKHEVLRELSKTKSVFKEPIQKARLFSAAMNASPGVVASNAARAGGAGLFKSGSVGISTELAAAGGMKGILGSSGRFLGTKAGLAGVAIGLAFEAPQVYNTVKEHGVVSVETGNAAGKAVGRSVGGMAGFMAGAKAGAAVGAVAGNLIPIPGVGAGIGAAVGFIGGGLAGSYVGSEVLGKVGGKLGDVTKAGVDMAKKGADLVSKPFKAIGGLFK